MKGIESVGQNSNRENQVAAKSVLDPGKQTSELEKAIADKLKEIQSTDSSFPTNERGLDPALTPLFKELKSLREKVRKLKYEKEVVEIEGEIKRVMDTPEIATVEEERIEHLVEATVGEIESENDRRLEEVFDGAHVALPEEVIQAVPTTVKKEKESKPKKKTKVADGKWKRLRRK